MPVRIKDGGVWRTVSNGNLRVRDGGTWKVANFVSIKINGAWFTCDYRGYPNPPQSPYIAAWDSTNFNTATLAWSAPAAGGAPVASYEVLKTSANGNWVGGYPLNVGNVGSYAFPTGQDDRCQFYVRAISTGGLNSADAFGWTGPIKVQMGHTELGHTETDNLTRAWDSTSAGQSEAVNGYRNTTHLRYMPAAVEASSWYFNLRENPGWAISKISPGTNREVYHVFQNAIQWGTVLDWSEPLVGWFSYVYWGQDQWWGFYVSDNIGWTASPSGLQRFVGEFRIHGIEHYTQQRYVVDRARAENSYW